MAENTAIEWARHSLNFWWGCREVSPGCAHCYARTLSERFGRHVWGSAETTERYRTKQPWQDVLKWNARAAETGDRPGVFVQSMSDFFEDHPQLIPWRAEAVDILEQCSNLTILLLTKRIENVPAMVPQWMDNWPAHIVMGTSVERQQEANARVLPLLNLPAPIKFLSVEPLLDPVDLLNIRPSRRFSINALEGAGTDSGSWLQTIPNIQTARLNWIIAGGESGRKARPMHPDWPRRLRDDCLAMGVPFLFNQWGSWVDTSQVGILAVRNLGNGRGLVSGGPLDGRKFPLRFPWGALGPVMIKTGNKAAGRLLDGREWNEYPPEFGPQADA